MVGVGIIAKVEIASSPCFLASAVDRAGIFCQLMKPRLRLGSRARPVQYAMIEQSVLVLSRAERPVKSSSNPKRVTATQSFDAVQKNRSQDRPPTPGWQRKMSLLAVTPSQPIGVSGAVRGKGRVYRDDKGEARAEGGNSVELQC